MARYAALQVCFTALCRLPMCRLPETAHRHSAQSHIVARLSRKIRIFAAALNWTKPASWTGGHQSINQSINQSIIYCEQRSRPTDKQLIQQILSEPDSKAREH